MEQTNQVNAPIVADPRGSRRARVSRHSVDALRTFLRATTITFFVARLFGVVACQAVAHRTRPRDAFLRQLADTLGRLGTTSIKLGQLIASSPNSFPEALVLACSDLRNNVGVTSGIDIHSILRRELGDRIEEFTDIETTPMAAASIAQVHAAHLVDETAAVVKVLRPSVRKTLVTDLRLISLLVRAVTYLSPSLRRIDMVGAMNTLADQMMAELDFDTELQNARLMESALEGTEIRTPHFFADLCTPNVLVMEYLNGRPLSVCAADARSATTGQETARKVLEALLVPMALHGAFHADMHAGNLLLGSDGRLGLIDFGFISRTDDSTRDRLTLALLALFERRFNDAAGGLVSLMDVSHADLNGVCGELAHLTSTFLDQEIGNIPVGSVIRDFFRIGKDHGLVLPPVLLSLMRQMLFLDGIIRDLDPTFNFLDEGASIIRRTMETNLDGSGSMFQPHSPLFLSAA